MPVAPVSRQARCLDEYDGTDLATADGRQEPLEAGTCHAGRHFKIATTSVPSAVGVSSFMV